MAYFRTCPHCGAHLDPGERCDCLEALRARVKELFMQLTPEEREEVSREFFEKRAAQGGANTPDGTAETVLTDTFSASIVTEE